MNFYMECRFIIMRDYLGDLVIYIVPYRRLYGSRILCVREVFIVCTLIMLVLYAAWSSLLCNLDFSCFKSLYYVPFTLVVLVCCSLPLLSSLTISSLFFFSNCNFNYERERAFEIHVKRSRTIKSCFVFLRTHTHTPSTRRTAGSSLHRKYVM